MQTTYRWYHIKFNGVDVTPKDFAKRISKVKGDYWFRLEDEEAYEYKFFRRSEVWVDQFDRAGNITRERVEGIISTSFSLVPASGSAILRVENPGRNMQFLLSAIEGAFGFGFSSKPLTGGAGFGATLLRRVDVSKLVSLKITNVAITRDCVARMEFASKEGISAERIPILKKLEYKQDSAKYELIYGGVRGHFAVSSSGLVRVGGPLARFILQALEQELLRHSRNR